MSAPVGLLEALEFAGADANAVEGSLPYRLAEAVAAVADLLDACHSLLDDEAGEVEWTAFGAAIHACEEFAP